MEAGCLLPDCRVDSFDVGTFDNNVEMILRFFHVVIFSMVLFFKPMQCVPEM